MKILSYKDGRLLRKYNKIVVVGQYIVSILKNHIEIESILKIYVDIFGMLSPVSSISKLH